MDMDQVASRRLIKKAIADFLQQGEIGVGNIVGTADESFAVFKPR
jgi:hypothetical protein